MALQSDENLWNNRIADVPAVVYRPRAHVGNLPVHLVSHQRSRSRAISNHTGFLDSTSQSVDHSCSGLELSGKTVAIPHRFATTQIHR